MNRVFQVLALSISIGMLTFLACRAQKAPPPAAPPAAPSASDTNANPAAPAIDAAPVDPAEVYFPASKSGGAFLEHQQAPK